MSLWTSDKVIKHFSTSIITGATADALALGENIAWSLCTNVSEDELTKTVASALLLRPECLVVRTRAEGDVMTTCPAASRRVVLRYNAGGELADYVDHFAWDAGFTSTQLDTPDAAGYRLLLIYVYAPSILLSYPAVRPDFCVTRAAKQMLEPTELQLEAYPADGEMQGEPPARRRRLRGKQADHRNHSADDPVADRGHGELENEGANQNDGDIGVKPEGITMAQWGVLRKLHLNLGHPTAASLKRRLRTVGVSQHVLDAVDSIACRHCQELRRPATSRTATLTTSTEFNQNVFVDEFEVELSDGTKVLSMMILDDASSFRVAIPTANFSSISGSESKRCLHQGWFLWAGAPQNLYYDMAKGHLASEFADQGDELSMVLRPIPAEKAIDFFKDMFVKLNAQFQFNQRNDPQEWCAAISFACNNHIRRNGFTPYQYVIGKSPRIPTSLVEVMEGDDRRLSANSAALFEDGPRRAEQTRAAANRAFFELDTDDAVRRALVGRVRPPRGPFLPGQLVYYWRNSRTKAFSKRMQVSQGWRGPCIVLAREGNSRLHLSYRGVLVLVTLEQTRHASRDEAELIAHEDLLRELSGLQRGSQRGFIDERGNAPGDPQNAEERHPENAQEDIPMDQVNDESEPQQDAPAEPLDHLRSAENEDASHEDEQGHALPPPSREPDTTQVDLRHHHSVEPEPPVARPHVEADIDESMQRPEERDQDNMNRIGRVRPRESDTRETAPVRRRLRRKTAPITTAYPIQQTEDDVAIENRKRDAFVARRTQPIKKGSRELRVIPPEWRDMHRVTLLNGRSGCRTTLWNDQNLRSLLVWKE